MNGHEDNRSRLSALMDGQAGADDMADLGARWRSDTDLRATWHAYHLIGDVMRSDDLASPPVRDEAFLQALRLRLAAEPVVLAPQPAAPVAEPRRRAWLAPAAAAAGFVVVAGVIVVLRAPSVEGGGNLASLAASSAPAAGVRAVAAQLPPAPNANGAVLRDARLDRYLEAHRRYGAGAMATLPVARPVEAVAVESK